MMTDPQDQGRSIRRRTVLGGGLAALGVVALPGGIASGAPGAAPEVAAAWVDPPNGYPEWNNNIGIFEVNSEPPHATSMPYADLQQALDADRTTSPYRLDLTGTWRFKHVAQPPHPDPNFHRTHLHDTPRPAIPVPP